MTHDEEIIKEATEIYEKNQNAGALVGDLLRIIKSQKAHIEKLEKVEHFATKTIEKQTAEIERLEKEQKALLLTIERARKERVRIQTILVNFMDEIYVFGNKNNVDTNSFAQIAILGSERDSAVKQIKSEAYRVFAEKITEIFLRYAHLHDYAEGARTDYIEAVDGTNIEMQSVWDVFTLKKYEIAEYEEMNRLQSNIELIEKERLLTELEKDFRLLAKELTESK